MNPGGGRMAATNEAEELLMIEEADAWFEYLEATRAQSGGRANEAQAPTRKPRRPRPQEEDRGGCCGRCEGRAGQEGGRPGAKAGPALPPQRTATAAPSHAAAPRAAAGCEEGAARLGRRRRAAGRRPGGRQGRRGLPRAAR